MPKYLEELIANPKVLYIYDHSLNIFGVMEGVDDRDFIVVFDNDYIPEEFKLGQDDVFAYYTREDDELLNFYGYSIKDWFEKVLNNDILAWICACLPKKYVYKEHVKLLLQTDPLKLRLNFDKKEGELIESAKAMIDCDYPLTGQKMLWEILVRVMFSNQIIENHKIVNLKEGAESYRLIVNGLIDDADSILLVYRVLIVPHLTRFKEYTNGILKAYKIKQNGG